MDIGQLANLLHETSEHHGAYEAIAASESGGRYMADVKHIVVP